MISETRVEKAVEFLRDSAAGYGKARGYLAFCDNNMRRVKSLHMCGKPGSVGDREASAYASPEYLQALEALEAATVEAETIRARRDAAEMTIEVWRSQNSSKRQGIVT
jgi:hypothetical protein